MKYTLFLILLLVAGCGTETYYWQATTTDGEVETFHCTSVSLDDNGVLTMKNWDKIGMFYKDVGIIKNIDTYRMIDEEEAADE